MPFQHVSNEVIPKSVYFKILMIYQSRLKNEEKKERAVFHLT